MRKNFYGQGNDSFICEQCKLRVAPLTSGSYRNHCPECLYSKHVDRVPGDRQEICQGLMRPTTAEHSAKKGWVITHECTLCGASQRNKAALNDAQPDNFDIVIALTIPE